MNASHRKYAAEMFKKFGYHATWNPGTPLRLGDIGFFRKQIFTRITDLESLGLSFDIRNDTSKTSLYHASHGGLSITTKLAGNTSPAGSILLPADAGLIVEFTKENSVLFKANNTITISIKDNTRLSEQIIQLYLKNKWEKDWVLITELVKAENATILISNSADGKIELKANANLSAAMIDIADASFRFSTQFSRGLQTQIISAEGLTPLFRSMQLMHRPGRMERPAHNNDPQDWILSQSPDREIDESFS